MKDDPNQVEWACRYVLQFFIDPHIYPANYSSLALIVHLYLRHWLWFLFLNLNILFTLSCCSQKWSIYHACKGCQRCF